MFLQSKRVHLESECRAGPLQGKTLFHTNFAGDKAEFFLPQRGQKITGLKIDTTNIQAIIFLCNHAMEDLWAQ
ncbi:MAG: hypothetical protein U5L00_06055 [Desulfovermiculus sp.]|nr:hypothetical protein [Desulfovermiculus sp.]